MQNSRERLLGVVAACCALGFGAVIAFTVVGTSPAVAQPSSIAAQLRPSSPYQLDIRVNGAPNPLGCIAEDGGTATNNVTTTAPCTSFLTSGNGLAGKVLLLYAQGAGRFAPVTTAAGYATGIPGDGDAGVPLAASERVIVTMPEGAPYLSWNSDGGVILEVWELK